jgi:hypothetical protein
MAKLRDKPPPPGYERHPLDPNLIRKIVPRTAAAQLYPNLPHATPAPVRQQRVDKSLAETLYPNLRRRP